MESFIEAYADRLKELMHGLDQALTGLPTEALDWSPGPELNSLTVLATHVAGATRYWIGDVVGQAPSDRDREREFQSVGHNEVVVRARLADVLAYSQQVLQGLTTADLTAERHSTRHGHSFTVAWALLRALDHLAEHVGHAQMTRQLWVQQQQSQQH